MERCVAAGAAGGGFGGEGGRARWNEPKKCLVAFNFDGYLTFLGGAVDAAGEGGTGGGVVVRVGGN